MQFWHKNHGQGVNIQSSFVAPYWFSSSCADRTPQTTVISCNRPEKNYVSICIQFLDQTTHRVTYSHMQHMFLNSKYGAHSCSPNICRTFYVLRMMTEEVSCWHTQIQPLVPAWVVTYLVASFFSCPRLIGHDVSQLWRLGVGENVCVGAKGRDK